MKVPITAEDLYRIQNLSHPRLAPNGEQVVYCVQQIDAVTQKKLINLWATASHTNAPTAITTGAYRDTAPEWRPDSKQIAFLSDRAGDDLPPQVFTILITESEPKQLTTIQGKIKELVWAPDGTFLLALVQKMDAASLARATNQQKKDLGVVERHYSRTNYKFDEVGFYSDEQWHLWKIDATTGQAEPLIQHPVYSEKFVALAPDGQTVAFVSNRNADPDRDYYKESIFLMPTSGGEMRELPGPPGLKTHLSFSPDGRYLSYLSSGYAGEAYRNTSLWIVPVDGSSSPKNLTAAHDIHVSAETMNDMGGTETRPAIWGADSQKLFFTVDQHGATKLMSISIDGEDLQSMTAADSSVGSVSTDRALSKIAHFQANIKDPGQLVIQDLNNKQRVQLTNLNPWLAEIDFGSLEEFWFKGADNNDLQGWLLKPPGFDPTRQYPSILEIHGGPLAQYGQFFMHEFYYLAAQGYVVYFCNPRGGQGYGEEHARAIYGNWGHNDYRDLMTFVDLVEQHPYIDKNRMGVTGGSYGGYMALWMIGHTQRFQAAVAQRVVSNMVSMVGSSDFNWRFENLVGLGEMALFNNYDALWEQSPMKHIGNAKTPTLIIHSEEDHRCPIEQGEQAFVALKRLGVDSEFVRFPGEPHGLSRMGRTDRRIARLKHITRWMDKYLKPAA